MDKIREIACIEKGKPFIFLGFSLNLDTGEIKDLIKPSKEYSDWSVQMLTVLLAHYSLAKPSSKTDRWIRFGDLPGGHTYELAFKKRAVQPIESTFGDNPNSLVDSARRIGGSALGLADASVEILSLEGIPLVYLLWGADEFDASANILFNETASCFLPTEDLAVLGEITTGRLIEVHSQQTNEK